MSEKQTLQIDMSEVMKQQHLSTDSAAGPQAVPDLPLHRLAGKCQLNELGDKHKALIMRERSGESFEEQRDVSKDSQKKVDDEDAAVTEIRSRMERLSCTINVVCPVTALIGVDPVKNGTCCLASVTLSLVMFVGYYSF
ncbi:unnamed protein product [Echinostoma caproni]|uniref:t-SNARE coiled-coil homology domain-containing protein n=1 Tax=Echinostoma caproni TaxID=27848 RepID=A0A183A2Y8_9TREM|nr:unnamed protein product [Echinostoma caproni]